MTRTERLLELLQILRAQRYPMVIPPKNQCMNK
ncbi:transcriptional regulator, partial [Klebsiella pneumoniae]